MALINEAFGITELPNDFVKEIGTEIINLAYFGGLHKINYDGRRYDDYLLECWQGFRIKPEFYDELKESLRKQNITLEKVSKDERQSLKKKVKGPCLYVKISDEYNTKYFNITPTSKPVNRNKLLD